MEKLLNNLSHSFRSCMLLLRPAKNPILREQKKKGKRKGKPNPPPRPSLVFFWGALFSGLPIFIKKKKMEMEGEKSFTSNSIGHLPRPSLLQSPCPRCGPRQTPYKCVPSASARPHSQTFGLWIAKLQCVSTGS